jgi:hypothetical protein
MRTAYRTFAALTLGFACLGLAASEFTPLASVAKATWPTMNHVGVVCDAAAGRAEIQALREALGSDATLLVMDTRNSAELSRAVSGLRARNVDYVVLMPGDRIFRDGAFYSTALIGQLSIHGIPSVGTTEKAIQQGAVFAVGAGTGGELLVSNKLMGHISVILPDKGQFVGAEK